ncbi:MAG: RNA-guided pseudouridylation complex pseudouridine synthase subunit Cbf5 [Candidatus Woesearchaeota archaeon]
MNSSKRLILKKSEGVFGKAPEERTVEELINYGLINIDKPKGPTSHLIVDYIKKILQISKAGHSGTLDPAVTGVQPITLGRATRITHFLLTAPKEYVGIMHLHKPVDETRLRKALEKFVGEITQRPPVKSAVKREERKRKIYELEILDIEEQDILFRMKCQAGTYVRKFCHDLGQSLGVGAHMAELRRTRAGPLTEEDRLVTLTDLQDAYQFYKEENNPKFLRYCLQPIEKVITYIPKCFVLDSAVQSLTHGRDLALPGIAELEQFSKDDPVAVMTLKGELIAIGTALLSAEEISGTAKGIAIKIDKVFMEEIQ